MICWIDTVAYDDADSDLKAAYDATRGPKMTIDNVMRVHSLRPAGMRASKSLYKAALHDEANTLPLWLSEVLASYVSILNGASYSLTNHWANAAHLIADPARSDDIKAALDADAPETVFDGKPLALLRFAKKLTRTPGSMSQADISALRHAGVPDGEILEAVQIIGYFCYVNRVLNALGASNEGEEIGYY